MTFTLKEFFKCPHKICVHTKTLEEYNKITKIFDDYLYNIEGPLISGTLYTKMDGFSCYKETTCLTNQHTFCDVKWAKEHDFPILMINWNQIEG